MRRKNEMGRWCRGLALSILLLSLGACGEIFPKRTTGEKLYRKHCADCHGIGGDGHTISSMGDPDANLLDDRWKHPADAAGMASVIRQGLVFEHPTFDSLSREEVNQIVGHVFSLRGETPR